MNKERAIISNFKKKKKKYKKEFKKLKIVKQKK